MATFKVTYRSSQDGDCCSVWTEADHAKEAARNVQDDYWDVQEILLIQQMSND